MQKNKIDIVKAVWNNAARKLAVLGLAVAVSSSSVANANPPKKERSGLPSTTQGEETLEARLRELKIERDRKLRELKETQQKTKKIEEARKKNLEHLKENEIALNAIKRQLSQMTLDPKKMDQLAFVILAMDRSFKEINLIYLMQQNYNYLEKDNSSFTLITELCTKAIELYLEIRELDRKLNALRAQIKEDPQEEIAESEAPYVVLADIVSAVTSTHGDADRHLQRIPPLEQHNEETLADLLRELEKAHDRIPQQIDEIQKRTKETDDAKEKNLKRLEASNDEIEKLKKQASEMILRAQKMDEHNFESLYIELHNKAENIIKQLEKNNNLKKNDKSSFINKVQSLIDNIMLCLEGQDLDRKIKALRTQIGPAPQEEIIKKVNDTCETKAEHQEEPPAEIVEVVQEVDEIKEEAEESQHKRPTPPTQTRTTGVDLLAPDQDQLQNITHTLTPEFVNYILTALNQRLSKE